MQDPNINPKGHSGLNTSQVNLRGSLINRSNDTIFITNFPTNCNPKEAWLFFKHFGQIKDIILPRKRDRNNNRICFVKTPNKYKAMEAIKGKVAI